MKTMKFKALGLLSLVLFIGPAGARGESCPAFTAAMVDAAWLAIDFSQSEPLDVIDLADSRKGPRISCHLRTLEPSEFQVAVGIEDGVALLLGAGVSTLLRTRVSDLSRSQEHACRREVLKSFVWNQHCGPLLDDVEDD